MTHNLTVVTLSAGDKVELNYSDLSEPSNITVYSDGNRNALLENVNQDRSYAITIWNADEIIITITHTTVS